MACDFWEIPDLWLSPQSPLILITEPSVRAKKSRLRSNQNIINIEPTEDDESVSDCRGPSYQPQTPQVSKSPKSPHTQTIVCTMKELDNFLWDNPDDIAIIDEISHEFHTI